MPEILLPAVTTARLHRIALTLPLTSLINEHLRLQVISFFLSSLSPMVVYF